jgi:hypothetical protein
LFYRLASLGERSKKTKQKNKSVAVNAIRCMPAEGGKQKAPKAATQKKNRLA